jgi:hypothetical protein
MALPRRPRAKAVRNSVGETVQNARNDVQQAAEQADERYLLLLASLIIV